MLRRTRYRASMAGLRQKIDPRLEEAHRRSSIGRLFVQDFARIEDEQQESAARERLRALDYVPGFLLCVHLVCVAGFLVGLGNPANPDPASLVPLGAQILLDFGLWAWLLRRRMSRSAPHQLIRGAAAYSLVTYGLWCAASTAAAPGNGGNVALVDLAVAAGILAVPIAFLTCPALVALGCFAFAAKFWFLAHDPAAAVIALLLSVLLV